MCVLRTFPGRILKYRPPFGAVPPVQTLQARKEKVRWTESGP